VVNARGVTLLDAQAFVRETYGPEAEARVQLALDPGLVEILAKPIREDAWYPVDALVAYLRTAQQALDPESKDFFRRQGFFGASRRRSGPLGLMLTTTEHRARLAPTTWRMFYDTGQLEVVSASPLEVIGRIHGFPAVPELCQRFLGIWEALSGDPGVPGRAEEPRCMLRGDPYCEIKVTFAVRAGPIRKPGR
jgi:hypothetical protein